MDSIRENGWITSQTGKQQYLCEKRKQAVRQLQTTDSLRRMLTVAEDLRHHEHESLYSEIEYG
jgi:hypothetical protein